MELQFHGAAGEVTGSCTLVQCAGRRILIDCGLIQGAREDEARNRSRFAFDPADIDAVILTHAHIDHSGRLPYLVKCGFKGPIYTHPATRDLCRIMLTDSAFLQERQAARDNRRRKRNQAVTEPLYTREDVDVAMDRFEPVPYNRSFKVTPDIDASIADAGHILGSAIVELTLAEDDRDRKVVFSGDLGHRGAPILRDPAHIETADHVVMESTYGDRSHRSWESTWDELGEILKAARASRGNILIPAFTIGRTQELLAMFRQNYEAWGLGHWQIFMDSPMASEATRIYEHHWRLYDEEASSLRESGSIFELPNLHWVESVEESIALNRIRNGAIIIAGSGMCTGGRIRHHLSHQVGHPGNQVIIVGFQARGTTGRMLVDGAETIQMWGKRYAVRAQVHTVGGLSAHADQAGLIDWYAGIGGNPSISLVHGEQVAMTALQAQLQAAGHDVHVPSPLEKLNL